MNHTEILKEIQTIKRLLELKDLRAVNLALTKFTRLKKLLQNVKGANKYLRAITYLLRNKIVQQNLATARPLVADAFTVSGEILRGLQSTINRGLRKGLEETELRKQLSNQFTPQRIAWANTWTNTAIIAQNRLAKLESFGKEDIELRYSGRASTRDTARAYLGVVKKRSEWEDINNSTGQPILIFGCGYNCSHRFDAV